MELHEIDLNLLLILDAMYDTGSTTLVAERLKVSQPTVSFSLGKLRDVFGDELFVRHGASMQPTPLAESIRELGVKGLAGADGRGVEIGAVVHRPVYPRDKRLQSTADDQDLCPRLAQ